MKVLVTGSRGWTDEARVRARLERLPAGSVVLHGGAPGADRMAARIARDLDLIGIEIKADWARDRRKAGIVRNLRMLDMEPEVVLAFWDGRSRGTRHCIEAAIRRGIPVEVA